jgi:hypothetical protein
MLSQSIYLCSRYACRCETNKYRQRHHCYCFTYSSRLSEKASVCTLYFFNKDARYAIQSAPVCYYSNGTCHKRFIASNTATMYVLRSTTLECHRCQDPSNFSSMYRYNFGKVQRKATVKYMSVTTY